LNFISSVFPSPTLTAYSCSFHLLNSLHILSLSIFYSISFRLLHSVYIFHTLYYFTHTPHPYLSLLHCVLSHSMPSPTFHPDHLHLIPYHRIIESSPHSPLLRQMRLAIGQMTFFRCASACGFF
jgi:hypothetical protein